MKPVRTTAAGVALAIAVVPVMLAACGSQPAGPAAAPSPGQVEVVQGEVAERGPAG